MNTALIKTTGFAACIAVLLTLADATAKQPDYEWGKDVFHTGMGDLTIHFIGHGTLMMEIGDMVIHIDPTGREADYDRLPEADLVLVTHEHGDHFDRQALGAICTATSVVVLTETCAADADMPGDVRILHNGDSTVYNGVGIHAVPAYNLVHTRGDGKPYHPMGQGNGYVLQFAETRIYIAGDTENVPEMKKLEGIDVAFLPMNLPYTMTPEMVADAAKAFRPKVLYPYHYGNTDVQQLVGLLSGEKDIEVRIREMQ